MSADPTWVNGVREALRPHIGALAYVVIEEALDSMGVGAHEMSVSKIVPFLDRLKSHLPPELDREALASEVGRAMLQTCVRTLR